jgi:hypothetical protein
LKIVATLDGREGDDFERPARPLPEDAVLGEEFYLAIAGAEDANLATRNDSETVFKADLRARVHPEEVGGQVAEIAAAKRPRETMSDTERAAELRQSQAVGSAINVKSGSASFNAASSTGCAETAGANRSTAKRRHKDRRIANERVTSAPNG